MTDEITQIRARLYRAEQGLAKEIKARKALQIGMDQEALLAFSAKVDEIKNKAEAVFICKSAVSIILFMAKHSKDLELRLKASDWVDANIFAPEEEWLSRENLTTEEWMKLVEEGTPLFEVSGKTDNGRPSNYE